MGWPTPSLDDVILSNETGGKRWLHALCLATNERQISLGLSQTQFIKGDGSEGSSLGIDAFTDVWIGGASDGAITNLNRCMTALKAMLTQTTGFGTVGTFIDSATFGATPWTLASIQTDVGLGAFGTAADGWTDLTFWKQIKEAYDRMLYCRKISVASGISLKRQESTTIYTNGTEAEVSWDECVADTPFSSTWTLGQQSGLFYGGFSTDPFTYAGFIYFQNDCSCSFQNNCSGSLAEAYYSVVAALGSGVSLAPAWTLTPSGGTPISVAATYSGYKTGAELSLGSSNQTDYGYTFSLPADFPSGGTTTPGLGSGAYSGYWARFQLQYADFYFDITGELTDQA